MLLTITFSLRWGGGWGADAKHLQCFVEAARRAASWPNEIRHVSPLFAENGVYILNKILNRLFINLFKTYYPLP